MGIFVANNYYLLRWVRPTKATSIFCYKTQNTASLPQAQARKVSLSSRDSTMLRENRRSSYGLSVFDLVICFMFVLLLNKSVSDLKPAFEYYFCHCTFLLFIGTASGYYVLCVNEVLSNWIMSRYMYLIFESIQLRRNERRIDVSHELTVPFKFILEVRLESTGVRRNRLG